MKKTYIALGIIASMFMLFQSCEKFEPAEPGDEELLDGPTEGLSQEEQQRFLAGDETFNDEFFTVEKGLGPVFVATSCGACHAGDGKGHPFVEFKRFGQADLEFMTQYRTGKELQHKAIPGYKPEVLPEGTPHTTLIAPAVTGLGFLQYIPDQDIIDYARKQREEGIVSGEINWITKFDYSPARDEANYPGNANISKTVSELLSDDSEAIRERFTIGVTPGRKNHKGEDLEPLKKDEVRYIGRFGKKAATFDLLDQTADALSEDIGIASIYRDVDVYSGETIDPEIDTKVVNNLAFYLKTLKAPVPRDEDDPTVIKGKELFTGKVNCAVCHKPTWKTGKSEIEAISEKEFHPYTDMLVHNMGKGLDDGYTEGSARSYEWRTPPLWGLGLSPDSQGQEYFLLHDGRAKSIEEAILLHESDGSEANPIIANYKALSQEEKDALIKFLESL